MPTGYYFVQDNASIHTKRSTDKKKGRESKLHLIILEEADFLLKERSVDDSTSKFRDSVVNQLLSKMDGVNELNNFLVVATTNRLDLVDTAFLRPGRFDVQLKIDLPNKLSRQQILRIKTEKLRRNELLDSEVDLEAIAQRTGGFSGARLAGLVNSAKRSAFQRYALDGGDLKVSQKDFRIDIDSRISE